MLVRLDDLSVEVQAFYWFAVLHMYDNLLLFKIQNFHIFSQSSNAYVAMVTAVNSAMTSMAAPVLRVWTELGVLTLLVTQRERNIHANVCSVGSW